MIEIDASIGYGQVFRTALSLSALTGIAIKIFNIRIRRPKPGLMPQHLKGLLTLAKLTHAKIKGAKIGSTEVKFDPQRVDIPKDIFIDIGTAGSITLLLQTVLPLIIFGSKSKVKLRIIGGTDVKGSPTILYYKKIFFYYLRKMGVETFLKIKKHGFYPKGGGEVILEVEPVNELKPIVAEERGPLNEVNVWSIASLHLKKKKVAERQILGVKEIIDFISSENFAYVESESSGSSLLVEAIYENCKLGEDALGEKRKRAEDVGREASEGILNSIKSGSCLDKYMADQIIPYVALANGTSSFTFEKMTDHLKTNIAVCEKILGVKFKIEENKIVVKGIGMRGNIYG